MFTKKELSKAQYEARSFIQKCEAFRALLTEHELPLSVNHNELKGVIRSQLFAKLLAVDAGLKMRFEMLRTEEAQQQLIATTIDLDGYEIVGQLERSIKELQSLYGSLMLPRGSFFCQPEREGISLSYLATAHGLDLSTWIQSQLMDWTGKEHVLAYFTTLATQLSQLRNIVRATTDSSAGLAGIVSPRLLSFFTNASQSGPIEPDEHFIMGQFIPKLGGRLAGFPGNMK